MIILFQSYTYREYSVCHLPGTHQNTYKGMGMFWSIREGYRVSGEDRPQSGRGRRVTETPLDRSDGASPQACPPYGENFKAENRMALAGKEPALDPDSEQTKASSRESGS